MLGAAAILVLRCPSGERMPCHGFLPFKRNSVTLHEGHTPRGEVSLGGTGRVPETWGE
jgi:hypothetical protein